jgi:hypothetical protein
MNIIVNRGRGLKDAGYLDKGRGDISKVSKLSFQKIIKIRNKFWGISAPPKK